MTARLEDLAWPLESLEEAVHALAGNAGLIERGAKAVLPILAHGVDPEDPHALGRMVEALVSAHGLEVEPSVVRYADAGEVPAPALVRMPTPPDEGSPGFLAIVGGDARSLRLVAPDRRLHDVRPAKFAAEMRASLDREHAAPIEALLDSGCVRSEARDGVRAAVLREQLGTKRITDAWRIRTQPGASFGRQLRESGVRGQAVLLVALHALQFALWIAAWWLIGHGALQGRIDWGWMTAWALLLATIVPLQWWTTRLQGTLALVAGRLLKGRLLTGALRIDPERIRHEGAGELLGRVIESEAVESLALSGALQAALAIIELLFTATVLWLGASGALHVLLLLLWALAAGLVALRYYRRRQAWSRRRLEMTHHLVENIAGHRTRLAQERRERWHDEEDRALDVYLGASTALDRLTPMLTVLLPRLWSVAAVVVLSWPFVAGHSASVSLAVSVGGILLGFTALRRLGEGVANLSGAFIAWEQARTLFEAARQEQTTGTATGDETRDAPEQPTRPSAVLDARDVTFRYPTRAEPVLRGCTLTLKDRDRVLLQGPSGGGKSTFASIIAGLRQPTSGLVLVGGLDRGTLGSHGWRRRVVTAPQFHENHVLTETFAFNLLMGRRWPPTDEDMTEAEAICRELGLGELLDRMPAGMLQLVGESGWQLSHGERSRVFMARALLQGGDVMILDESFAALDPENVAATLECVLRRAPALIVIAHP